MGEHLLRGDPGPAVVSRALLSKLQLRRKTRSFQDCSDAENPQRWAGFFDFGLRRGWRGLYSQAQGLLASFILRSRASPSEKRVTKEMLAAMEMEIEFVYLAPSDGEK